MTIGSLAFAAIAFSNPGLAKRDSIAAPFDYIRETKGGKYVFVMLAPKEWQKYAYNYRVFTDPDSDTDTDTEKRGALFKGYPRSGLYLNDGSRKQLWTVNWYSYRVWPCSDGQHVVRIGPPANVRENRQTMALTFYRVGLETKTYRVCDLIRDSDVIPQTTSHYHWLRETNFFDDTKQLKVKLLRGYDFGDSADTLLFDITSGSFNKI